MDLAEVLKNFRLNRIITRDSSGSEPADRKEFRFSQHPKRELLFVLDGSSRYMLNGTVRELSPGDIVMIDSFVPHSFGYTEKDHDLLHLWVWFDGVHSFHGTVFHISSGGAFEAVRVMRFPRELEDLVRYRWDLLRKSDNSSPEEVSLFMKHPFELVVEEALLQYLHPFSGTKKGHLSEFLKNYIRECSGRDCSLRKLSGISGYSTSHLSHTFQAETGESIGDYIDGIRLEYARSAEQNGMKQKEIASELGFASAASYWNWTKRVCKKQE